MKKGTSWGCFCAARVLRARARTRRGEGEDSCAPQGMGKWCALSKSIKLASVYVAGQVVQTDPFNDTSNMIIGVEGNFIHKGLKQLGQTIAEMLFARFQETSWLKLFFNAAHIHKFSPPGVYPATPHYEGMVRLKIMTCRRCSPRQRICFAQEG